MAQGEQSDFPLLTNCKLTINSKVVGDTEKLYKLLTNEMKFKIAGIDPLIIEKDDPSQVDIEKVFDGIRSLCKGAGSFVDLEKTCEICFDQKTKYPLKCCGKYLCQDCEKKMANCPFCRRFWRVLIGDQPPGTMAIHDGFWEIKYSFPSGVQELTNCKLTINSKVVVDTEKLYKLLTNELKFKIIGFDPLIIEKDDPSQVDIGKVFDGIRSLCKAIFKVPREECTRKFTPSSSVSTKTPGASKASLDLGSLFGIGSTVASPSEITGNSSAYLIGKFTLHTDTRPAFSLPSDITITVGKPFDKLSGLSDFSVSSNQKEKEGTKNVYQMYEVFKPKSSQRRKLYALLPEPDDTETIKQSIGNLETIIQSPNHKMFMETVKNVVLTSSILYSEPCNTPKKVKKNTYDRKKVINFAQYLFQYLQRASGVTASTITLVGNEDTLQHICKVIESRGVKKISPEDAGSSIVLEKTCEICVDQKTNYPLKCCGKYLCQDCRKKMANCPFCRTFWRVLIGDQPRGTMTVRALHDHGFWEIKYSFPSGFQEACHPNPGAFYTGVNRTAYIPMNEDGLNVLMLLRIAFLRRLTFTIGRSLTTDRENTITWNDIHHKTSFNGGLYGYPDSNYLFNVTQELANKGVTFDTISADEGPEISNFKYCILTKGCFY